MKKLLAILFLSTMLFSVASAQYLARDGFADVLTAVRATAPNAALRAIACADTNIGADGRASSWIYHFINPANQQWTTAMYMGQAMAFPSSPQASYLQDMSTTFVNSDVVMTAAENNGGAAFRRNHTNLAITLMAGTFPLTGYVPAGTPVWMVIYSGMSGSTTEQFTALVNMTTGALIVALDAPEPVALTLPTSATLQPNFPNPFNSATTIRYSLPQASNVSIKVVDVSGREVANLLNSYEAAGSHSLQFRPAGDLPSGKYFVQLNSGKLVETQSILYLK